MTTQVVWTGITYSGTILEHFFENGILRVSRKIFLYLTLLFTFFMSLYIKDLPMTPSAWIYTLLPHSSVPLHKELVRLSIMASVGLTSALTCH